MNGYDGDASSLAAMTWQLCAWCVWFFVYFVWNEKYAIKDNNR
jgi:hypothetical protein